MNKKIKIKEKSGSSFRDPSGFVFYDQENVYRQVNKFYQAEYDAISNAGLFRELIKRGLLINFKEVEKPVAEPDKAYKILQIEKIPFISYPYEWSFSQLKDAARLTLKIQQIALDFSFSLKDASAYNIQFYKGRPIFIDLLSFEKYQEKPWIAYRQFCQHFLAPLSLISFKDHRLSLLSRLFIDGIPLDMANFLLPKKTYFKFSLLSHLHLHARSQKYYADKETKNQEIKMNKKAFTTVIKSLKLAVDSLKWAPKGTEWAEYYDETNYTASAFTDKKNIIREYLNKIKPKTVWDLGANQGVFTLLSAEQGAYTISSDFDPAAIEKAYLYVKNNKKTNILPVIIDLTNPSPDLGWQNRERKSFIKRGPVDLVMALALVHHLAISNNTTFKMIADFFQTIGRYLVIEFVPKNDSKVRKLLSTRKDIFFDYNQEKFEEAFKNYFKIKEKRNIRESARIIYLMENKNQ